MRNLVRIKCSRCKCTIRADKEVIVQFGRAQAGRDVETWNYSAKELDVRVVDHAESASTCRVYGGNDRKLFDTAIRAIKV